jgi:hypothetical protein
MALDSTTRVSAEDRGHPARLANPMVPARMTLGIGRLKGPGFLVVVRSTLSDDPEDDGRGSERALRPAIRKARVGQMRR